MTSFYDLKKAVLSDGEEYKTRPHIWHKFLSGLTDGVSLEFGVWSGASINYMARVRPEVKFHGFDSFEGLPEDWIRGFPAGSFSTELSKLKFVENIEVHKGWFEHTLPSFVESFEGTLQGVHIDCDLGSSTDCVLSTLSPLLKQHKPLLLFDEFYNYNGFEDHEFKSFLNWVNREEVAFKVLGRNINHQQVLIQLC